VDTLLDLEWHPFKDLFPAVPRENWMAEGIDLLFHAKCIERTVQKTPAEIVRYHALLKFEPIPGFFHALMHPSQKDSLALLRSTLVPKAITIGEAVAAAEDAISRRAVAEFIGANPVPVKEAAPDVAEMLVALVNALPLMIDAINRIETRLMTMDKKVTRLWRDLGGDKP
jgi:hypothetical protein